MPSLIYFGHVTQMTEGIDRKRHVQIPALGYYSDNATNVLSFPVET